MRAIRTTVISVLTIGLVAGSAVGAVTQGDESAPVAAAFKIERGDEGQQEIYRVGERTVQESSVEIVAPDPRATGTFTHMMVPESVWVGEDWLNVSSETARLDNEDGSWIGSGRGLLVMGEDKRTRKQVRKGRPGPLIDFVTTYELAGTGGYAGLTLFIVVEPAKGGIDLINDRWWGMIVPSDIVPPPIELPGASIPVIPEPSALQGLSDDEHFGVFLGHVMGLLPSLQAGSDEFATLPPLAGADAETYLSELLADPDTLATVLSYHDRVDALFTEELAWLDAHPPRPCWAVAHGAWRGFLDLSVANTRKVTQGLRTEDAGLLKQAQSELEGSAESVGDMFARLGTSQTCLHGLAGD